MTCQDLRQRLSAYAQGSLPAGEAAAIEAHLSGCEACSAWIEGVEPALAEVGRLPRSIEPPADVWAGIDARLSPRGLRGGKRRITLPGWMLAAAATLLVAVSAGVTAVLLQDERRDAETPRRPAIEFEAQYSSATADMLVELGKARSRLDPLTIAVIERNLRVIDSALVESRRALAGDPGNQALEQLVVAVWRQKVDFLRRAMTLAPAS